jgi:hypothetical protein
MARAETAETGVSSMWTTRSEQLGSGRAIKFAIQRDSVPVSYFDVLDKWQNDSHFRSFFIATLAETLFSAFRWETPPITTSTADRPFEFVVWDHPGLAQHADVNAFAEHFRCAAQVSVVEFSNLGKDAILVVPCPIGPISSYGQIGAFVRQAPQPQVHALWELVGAAMQRRLGVKPVWLSTAGAGVSWLHIRLDDRPKYYGYAPYREAG